MTDRTYSKSIHRELVRLAALAGQRETEDRLKRIGTTVNSWKKGRLDEAAAMAEVRRIAEAANTAWSEGADPGVPVAHGIAAGYISPDEVSEKARTAIEVLVTLAEI